MLDLLPMLSHNFPLLLYSLTEFSRLVFFTCSPFIPFLSPKQITYIPIISWRILENLMGVLSYYIHWQLCCLFVALTFLPYSSELDHLLQWCTTCSLKLPVLPGFLPTLNFFFFFWLLILQTSCEIRFSWNFIASVRQRYLLWCFKLLFAQGNCHMSVSSESSFPSKQNSM